MGLNLMGISKSTYSLQEAAPTSLLASSCIRICGDLLLKLAAPILSNNALLVEILLHFPHKYGYPLFIHGEAICNASRSCLKITPITPIGVVVLVENKTGISSLFKVIFLQDLPFFIKSLIPAITVSSYDKSNKSLLTVSEDIFSALAFSISFGFQSICSVYSKLFIIFSRQLFLISLLLAIE